MAIDIKPLSITSMFNNIKSFFQSQENNSKWRDLTTGAEGNFLMRMLANVVAVISSRIIMGRREQFHDTANFMSSQIALAVNNGYPVYRGRNHRRRIKLVLDSNINMTIPALSVVGFYDNDYSIITLEEINPSKNDLDGVKTVEFDAVIGALKEITWPAKTSALKKFIRHEQGISEDYILYLAPNAGSEAIPVPTSKYAKDKINNKYYIYTNHYKSVTIEYLNNLSNATYKYDDDSVFTLRYVELADMDVVPLTADMFTIGTFELDEDGNVTNSEAVISSYRPFESIDDIKQNSPIYRERQNLIRSKEDWKDAFKESLPAFKEVTYRVLTPSYTQISYIKDDFTLLKEYEIEDIHEALEPGRYFGRPFPDVEGPKRELTTLDITLGLINTYKYEDDIKADVQNILNNMYVGKFGQTLDVYDIEKEIKELSYVKYARVSIHMDERKNFTKYKKGDTITEDIVLDGTSYTKIYRCKDILGKTSNVEPIWFSNTDMPEPENIKTDIKVKDNTIVWQCYKKLSNIININKWSPNSYYAIGDFVYSESVPNYVFKCVSIVAKSGLSTPDIVGIEEGDFIEDGDIISVCRPYDGTVKERKSKEDYELGDLYNISSTTFEVVGFSGTTAGASSLKVKSNEQELYPIPLDARSEELNGKLYIDKDVRAYVKQGDLIQVSANLLRYDEDAEAIINKDIIKDNLTLSAVISAEIKDYDEDEESESESSEESSEEEEPTSVTVNTNIDIDLSNSLYTAYGLSSRIAPEASDVVGGIVDDYQLTLGTIAYDETLEDRVSQKRYSIGDKFNIPNIPTHSFVVMGFISAGMSSGDDLDVTGLAIGDVINDYQLKLEAIEYDSNYGLRNSFSEYAVNSIFNILNIEEFSLKVIGITDAGIDLDAATENDGNTTSSTEIIEESTDGEDSSDEKEEEKVDENANWKQLKTIKDKMGYIQSWITSESNDTLRTPADVLAFYATLGSDRITLPEIEVLKQYYNEYNEADEKQIYLHMEQFGSTRVEAINELTRVNQLPNKPFMDINCVKYLDSNGNLVYIDRYGSAVREDDGTLIFSEEYNPLSATYAIRREDSNGNTIKIIRVLENNVVEETYKKVFVVTVTDVSYNTYSNIYINKPLTCIETATPVDYYLSGSTVNFAYNTILDNNILWEEVNDIEKVEYGWNVYPEIKTNISLKS